MNFRRGEPHARPARPVRILLLEDSELDAELVREHLRELALAHALERAATRDEFVAALARCEYDLILADYALPAFDGMAALALAQERCPETPFVFVSATLGEEVAVEALKRGATDYVLKQRLERLPGTVLRALAEAKERSDRRRAEQALHRLIEDKTLLLHELDHRVKNNLQVLLSLVAAEIRASTHPETRQVLSRLKRRLTAIATVHRQLYGSEDVARFDMADVMRELTADLAATSGRDGVTAEYRLEPVHLPASKAVSVALLLNELVSNALANAYDHRRGRLEIRMRPSDGGCVVEIADDAFSPGEKANARAGTTAGILTGLSRQLGASVEWPDHEPDVLVRVVLPLAESA